MMPAHQITAYTDITQLVTPDQNTLPFPVKRLFLDNLAIQASDESPFLRGHITDFHYCRLSVRQLDRGPQVKYLAGLFHNARRHLNRVRLSSQLATLGTENAWHRVRPHRARV